MEQARIGKPAKTRLSSVANSIRLLTSFSGDENELGITTLATRLRLAKSTVHRLAATLTGSGFLEQNSDTGKYRLGMALFELGALVRRRMDVANEGRCAGRPHSAWQSHAAGEGCGAALCLELGKV